MRARFIYFSVGVLALTAILASQLRSLISFSFEEGYSSHIVLAPVICAYLLWHSRENIFQYLESAFLPAALFAAIASGVLFLSRHYQTVLNHNDSLSLIALSFCLFVIAFFLGAFGKKAARCAIFPLAMLLFFIPIPSEIAQKTIVALQSGSAVLVNWLFVVLGVPVLRQGLVFTVPGVSIEIAAECSGINSSVALLIVALLVAQATLRKTSSRVIFVLLSLPLSIVKNAIRIVTLTLLATHIDMSFLTGNLHRRGGILFFLLTLLLMVPVWKWLKKSEEHVFSENNFVRTTTAGSAPPAS